LRGEASKLVHFQPIIYYVFYWRGR